MSFIDNIVKSFGLDLNVTPVPYRAVILGGRAAYFENVRAIKSYETSELRLLVKDCELIVKGKGLSVKKYCAGDLVVVGEVRSVEEK